MKTKLLSLSVLILMITSCGDLQTVTTEANAEQVYNEFVKSENPNVAQLNLFFTLMPKGGDIHHHYSGSIYVESYLDWLEKANKFINSKTLKISDTKAKDCITVAELRDNDTYYRALLSLWSNKDFSNHSHDQAAPDASFFNTFGYFGSIATCNHEGLLIIKERAKKENVAYIETMLKAVSYPNKESKSFDFDFKIADSALVDSLNSYITKIDADPDFNRSVDEFVSSTRANHENIDDEDFVMRYQSYVSRNSNPTKVFANLYAGFMACDKEPLLVGVNIVGPENGIVALRDYSLHMKMFNFLKTKFPKVNIAMHAGELTVGMVRPKDLNFHISEAINIAGARRIGHGVDLPFESNSLEILDKMKQDSIALELNLTSNDFILGVKGDEHPYSIYAANGVPIVVCTDDSGVSRNTLTDEFVHLATRYKPDYATIKKYVYNSIRYSFLDNDNKKIIKDRLDSQFVAFEAKMKDYREKMN